MLFYNKKVIHKNCVSFTDCINEITNTQVVNAKDIDVVMLIHNLIKYSGSYSKHQNVYDNIIKVNQL